MERYLFFNTHTAQVIEYRDFAPVSDKQKLAFESYSLLQNSNFTLKSIKAEELYCFNYRTELGIAVVCVFAKTIPQEDGSSITEAIFELFLQHFASQLGRKFVKSELKQFKKSVQIYFESYLSDYIEGLSVEKNISFLHIVVVITPEQLDEVRRSADHFSILANSLISDTNIATASFDRVRYSNNTFSKRYPLSSRHSNGKVKKLLFSFVPDPTYIDDSFTENLFELIVASTEVIEAQNDSFCRFCMKLNSKTLRATKKNELTIIYLSENELEDSAINKIAGLGRVIMR